MRVLSLLTTDSLGGAEFAAVDLLAALQLRGADCHLLTNRPELVRGTSVTHDIIDLGPKLSRRTIAPSLVAAPRTRRAMADALQHARGFDVLLVHFKKEQLTAASLPEHVTGPVVWAEWGPLPSRLRRGLPRRVYAAAARRPRAVLAESDATARSLTAAGVASRKIQVVGNVFNAEELRFDEDARRRYRRRLGLADDALLLGCVSRLHMSKRLDVVVNAMRHLPEDVTLVVAGSGEDEDELRVLAEPLGERVRFFDTPRGEVAGLLSAADIQIYAPSASEGAARAITLGHLARRPVIATAAAGTPGVLPPGTGSVVSPEHDPVALAQLVLAYRVDETRRLAEGEAGERHARARLGRLDPVGTALRALEAAVAR